MVSENNSREMLLRKIAMYSFAMWELHMYLDTHKNDTDAKALHDKYAEMYKECTEEYERLYGPLNIRNVNTNTMSNWVSNPWPWDLEGE